MQFWRSGLQVTIFYIVLIALSLSLKARLSIVSLSLFVLLQSSNGTSVICQSFGNKFPYLLRIDVKRLNVAPGEIIDYVNC